MPRTKRSWVDKILVIDVSQFRWVKRCSLQLLKFIILVIKEFGHDRCYEKSAALAFVSLLCIFPLIAIYLFLIPMFFGTAEGLPEKITNFVIENIVPFSDSDNTLQADIQKSFTAFQTKAGTVGIFGIIALLCSSISLFITIEKSFNSVWGIERRRHILRRLIMCSGVILWLPVLIGMSFYFTTVLTQYKSPVGTIVGSRLTLLLPFLLGFVGFAFSYYFIPNTKVQIKSAVIAALITTLLWEFAKAKFGIWIRKPPVMHSFFKTLGIIPIFIVWLYCVWVIILLGTEISYTLQNFRRMLSQVLRKISLNIDFVSLLAPLILIAEHFNSGEGPVSFEKIRTQIYSDVHTLAKALDLLAESGFILFNEDADTYILNRPPERIFLHKLINLDKQFRYIFPGSTTNSKALADFINELDGAILEKVSDRSLKELLTGKA